MITPELQKAIDTLQIRDVYLRDFVARCIGGFDPKYDADFSELSLETMHGVKESAVVEVDEEGGAERLLRVIVVLGVRWINETGFNEVSEEELESNNFFPVCAFIEAEFVAEYSIEGELEQACIDEFALKNASYHVWPFWRELLASQCVRMNLPRLMLPTVQLADNRYDNK